MIKRALVATAAAAAMVLTAVPAANADFHLPTQACAGGVGTAHVALTASGGNLNFSGSVVCPGATSAAITSLVLTPAAPPGASVSGSTASCGPCDSTPIVGSGSTPASPGVYYVRMTFTATGPGGTYSPGRKMGWLYTGSGQPTLVCNNQGTVRCPT